MKFSVAAALLVAGVSAMPSNVTIVTEVVSEYTTYCPGPTEITHGGSTYTVTEATTLTITDCPCTITMPVTTSTSPAVPTMSHVETTTAAEMPTVSPPPAGYNSTIVTMPTIPPTGAPPAVTTPGGDLPAAAGKTVLSVGLLAGAVGLAAFL
ncbi:hypothetical protein S40285_01265 [Stachybotrys chlorohalonatus IBT 40285]|jgi:hypothetical protein|uniref:Clock-controlled protein 6 n=1 Tax=Stachybotrys chlorohalonatus (strain IBT 40285) TaxID=1283841 RepID=A0A084QQY8_STAC4|nr:hypothetical protein S40285_01265 [Stachybotrys chlorohalonata IBT 40285]